MPRRRLVHLAMVGGLLAIEGVAQRPVITVGGISPDFPDLPAAVAAAAPGSVIEVRPGTYTGFVTGKPLRIELQGATVQAPPGAAYAIAIDTMLAADGLVVTGPGQVTSGTLGAVRVAHCSGPVVLEALTMTAGSFQPALDVLDAANVHLSRSILSGMPGLQAELCAMVCAENVIGGPQGAAAVVDQALFESSRSIYLGVAGPGLRVFSSSVRLSSDGTGALSVAWAPVGVPISVLEAFDSDVRWLPASFSLTPANGAPPLTAVNSTEVLEEVPMLNAGPAPLGGTATARLTMSTPTVALMAVSYLLPQPLVIGDTGLYADPVPAVLVAAGLADLTGLTFAFAMPANPALRGTVLCFQGVVFAANGPQLSGAALWAAR
ncbi:MAG: hypothetical protein R3F29_11195 [Planctomycetota bacterium]